MAVSWTPTIQHCLPRRMDRRALYTSLRQVFSISNKYLKYTPTAQNVETGSSNPCSTPCRYFHQKYREHSALHCAESLCVRYTPFSFLQNLSRTAMMVMCSERLLIIQIWPGQWRFGRRRKSGWIKPGQVVEHEEIDGKSSSFFAVLHFCCVPY